MPGSEKRILVHGSIAIDYIMDYSDNLFKNCSVNAEKQEFEMAVMPEKKVMQYGGTAGNISYNLGLLGTKCEVMTSVGRDFESSWYKKKFSAFKNIKLNLIEYTDEFCANAYIVNDVKKQQLIIYHGGATQRVPEKSLKERGIEPQNYSWAINSPENPKQMLKVARDLHELGISTIMDTGQVTPAFTMDELLQMMREGSILICNEHEYNLISSKTQLEEKEILENIPTLILTKGTEGSYLITKEGSIHIPLVRTDRVLDPTGAGDGYRAGLLTALNQGMSVEDGCKVGATVASFVVETMGGQSQVFNGRQFRERFEKNFGPMDLAL